MWLQQFTYHRMAYLEGAKTNWITPFLQQRALRRSYTWKYVSIFLTYQEPSTCRTCTGQVLLILEKLTWCILVCVVHTRAIRKWAILSHPCHPRVFPATESIFKRATWIRWKFVCKYQFTLLLEPIKWIKCIKTIIHSTLSSSQIN